jgi:hypothetical protein
MCFTPIDLNDHKLDRSKVYKIKYTINMLPNTGEYIEEGGTSKDRVVN